MEYAVILENVTKTYGDLKVLDGITIRIRKGESACIIGKNGSGKSTLLRVIAGLTDFEGRVTVNASGIGFVAQSPALYPKLTVEDNLDLFIGLTKSADEAWVRELVEVLGLEEYLKTPVEKLSHGTVKKVDLVCALVGNPELILLDEPLVSLDVESREAILSVYDLFRERNKTIITVTHLVEALGERCERIYVLSNGRLNALNP